jgi:hypothetical protein
MTPRRVMWVVEHDGSRINRAAICDTQKQAMALKRWLIRKCGMRRSELTVTRYVPATPKRRSPVDK